MKFKNLLVLLAVSVSILSATVAKAVSSLSANIAEQVYFSAARSQNFKDWVNSSKLPEATKRDVRANLKGHSLEASKLSAVSWKEGSSVITVGKGASSYTIDFASIENHQVKINNKTIFIPANALFSEVLGKFKAALNDKKGSASSLQSLLITPAYAAEDETLFEASTKTPIDRATNYAGGAFIYIIGVDFLTSCNGHEAYTKANCVFKSDSSAILSDIGEDNLLEFTCKGDQVSSYKYQDNVEEPDTRHPVTKVSMDYKDGKISAIHTVFQGSVSCNYEVNEKMELIHVDGDSVKLCLDVRSASDVRMINGPLEKGDKIKSVSGSGTSIQRVQSCCKSEKCKTEIKEAIAKSSSRLQSKEKNDSQKVEGVK